MTQHTPTMTLAQRRALRTASHRADGCICPLPPSNASAETLLLNALVRKGWATDAPCPVITDAGRAAIAKATGSAA